MSMAESVQCREGVTTASQVMSTGSLPWATAWDIKREGTVTEAHTSSNTGVMHILQYPTFPHWISVVF